MLPGSPVSGVSLNGGFSRIECWTKEKRMIVRGGRPMLSTRQEGGKGVGGGVNLTQQVISQSVLKCLCGVLFTEPLKC
jgi:hypothetical protein